MAERTVGQEEDDRAFEEMLEAWALQEYGTEQYMIHLSPSKLQDMRLAFDAGMQRGEEKRGCCETKPCYDCRPECTLDGCRCTELRDA